MTSKKVTTEDKVENPSKDAQKMEYNYKGEKANVTPSEPSLKPVAMKARVAATVKRLRLYEEGAAGSDEEVAEGSDEVGSLQDVLDQVCSALRVKAVHLQSVMPGNRAQHKGSRFLSVDGDEESN